MFPFTRTAPPSSGLPWIRSGGNPSFFRYEISAPSERSASTWSRIGRSSIRFSPTSVQSPGLAASAAQSGRIAVPAFPRSRTAGEPERNAPPVPATEIPSGSSSVPTPSAESASSMRAVSSERRRFFRTVVPSPSAAARSARLLSDFEPGSRTVPSAFRRGPRTILEGNAAMREI